MDDINKGMEDCMPAWIVEWDGRESGWLKNGIKMLYSWWTLEKVHKAITNGVLNKELDWVVFDSTSISFCCCQLKI